MCQPPGTLGRTRSRDPHLHWLEQFGAYLAEHKLGEVANVAGVVISIVGFGATLWNVLRSKSAAKRAEAAAMETRRSITIHNTLADFTRAMATMEEIKRLHRSAMWPILPDRYSVLKQLLLSIRSANANLARNHRAALQSAIVQLTEIEDIVERSLAPQSPPANVPNLNRQMSTLIEKLSEVLVAIRDMAERQGNG